MPRITATTTLGDLSVELLSYGLRSSVILTGRASRFEVTLTDPNGLAASAASFDLAEAFDSALAAYRRFAGGVQVPIVCYPQIVAYASGKEIPEPGEDV